MFNNLDIVMLIFWLGSKKNASNKRVFKSRILLSNLIYLALKLPEFSKLKEKNIYKGKEILYRERGYLSPYSEDLTAILRKLKRAGYIDIDTNGYLIKYILNPKLKHELATKFQGEVLRNNETLARFCDKIYTKAQESLGSISLEVYRYY